MRIALADGDAGARGRLVALLARLGHEAAVSSGRRLVELCHVERPDLVIADVLMPGTTGVEAAAELSKSREVPVILAAGRAPGELLGEEVVDHVMAFLTKPADEAQLREALRLARLRFEHYLAVKAEARSPGQALADRRLLEGAKGAVARRRGVGEGEAFRRLRERAVATGRRLAEVAREVMAAERVFAGLDRPVPDNR